MKKSIYLTLLLWMGGLVTLIAQNESLVLHFNAEDAYTGQVLAFDSVVVANPSRNCDTTLFDSQPELLLDWISGIEETMARNGFFLKEISPNPFDVASHFDLLVSERKHFVFTLTSISGKICFRSEQTLSVGNHRYAINAGHSGIYALNISDGKTSITKKLVSSAQTSGTDFKILLESNSSLETSLKNGLAESGFTFQPGDGLLATAYVYGHEEQVLGVAPTSNYTFNYSLESNILDFASNTNNGYAPFNVQFALSSNLPWATEWLWDFGDGDSSTLWGPSHIYQTEDTYYSVSLTAKGNGYEKTIKKTNYIRVMPDLAEVDFVANFTSGIAPQSIHFTGYTNIDNPTMWQWSFGDGTTYSGSGAEEVDVTYTQTGDFTVILQVFNDHGMKTTTKTNYIHIRNCPSTITDADGNVYQTSRIGSQCWMTENLNTGVRISGSKAQVDNGQVEKYCYNNNTGNCEVYGGLYTLSELMDYSLTDGTQGICPEGWHIPEINEFTRLTSFLGSDPGAKMKEAGSDHWNNDNTNATNSSGFTALGGGHYIRDWNDYSFEEIKAWAIFATSSIENREYFPNILLRSVSPGIIGYPVDSGEFGINAISVRCVQDSE